MKPRPSRRRVISPKIVSWLALRPEIDRDPNTPFLIEISSTIFGCYVPAQMIMSNVNFKAEYGIDMRRVDSRYIITR